MSRPSLSLELAGIFAGLGLPVPVAGGLVVHSPIDGSVIGACAPAGDVAAAVGRARAAFLRWREVPAPRRGEVLRRFGLLLRQHKTGLGRLVSIESGKILSEGQGEVQEMVDMCDFAVGLSRQLYGLTKTSERPGPRMMESWQPLGGCAVITAFNCPAAVWAWNAALALVCGDSVIWKPSSRTPLTALACQGLLLEAMAGVDEAPPGLSQLLVGAAGMGGALADHPDVALVSATGSTAMGRSLAPRVAARFGRCLLELGGNNGMIVTPSAELELALRAIVFAAAGTAGQRCTTLRRLFVHESIAAQLLARVQAAFASLTVGNPLQAGVLVGPLIDAAAVDAHRRALAQAQAEGGVVHGGETVAVADCLDGCYVRPALVEMPAQSALVCRETFSPILYAMRYRRLDEAIAAHNAVPQGLASSIFTTDLREAERFMSAAGSDCGIVNVNIGPSGAEIGGAFGGEKETGGGREAGSDAWRAYMRRSTSTINYSRDLPLAQGVRFDQDSS